MKSGLTVTIIVLALAHLPGRLAADCISWNGNTVEMDFVTIGNTNNAGDPDGSPTNCGAVAYEYRIGKYEVSEHQFSCTSGPGNENHKPKAWITWYEAVRFCNWLTTGSEETGLYVFVEGEFESIRNRQDAAEEYGVVYCLPTEDEWYKAAYYDPDKPGGAGYWDSPAGTNTMYARPPAEDDGAAANAEHVASGTTVEIDAYPLSASPYGTQQQAGNVYEWNETSIDTNRGCRGGSYYHDISDAYRGESSSYTPDGVAGSIGFRVVAIGDAFYHSLMATAEEHGSVSPGPSVRVRNGSNVLFTITTDEYWHIDDVTTNGTSIGPVTSFVWSNVTQRGVVYVSTAPDLAAGGTPHWWLASFGWTNHFDAVETGNPDADAFTTGEEYIADTDPTNGFSFLSITSLISATDCTVHFISSSNRLYNLKGCSNLTTGAWSNVPGATARTGVGGNDALSDTNTPLLGPYYRLGVKVPE